MTLLLLLACIDGPGTVPVPEDLALASFEDTVQPVLSARCANPSCHGYAGRPLAVYAEHQHRRDPDDLHRDLPLTEEEIAWNAHRAAAFLLAEDPGASWLLTKPLAEEAGGVAHTGGTQFQDTANPELLAIEAWVGDVVGEER